VNRRTLLETSLAAASLLVAGRLYAAPTNVTTNTRFLFVFLRGAYDAANVVIPVASDFYYQSRPTLAIGKPGSNTDSALPLDANWGLHPALRDSIYPLYQNGQLAFVPFAGTTDTSRSHFETQDTIELGQDETKSRDYQSGFLNRLASVLSDNQAIAFSDQLPLSFRGARTIPNIGLGGMGKSSVDDRQSQLIQAMYKNTQLGNSVDQGFQVRNEVYQTISQEMQAANRNAVSPKGFELSGQRIGQLMRDKFNLGFVDVGGWDTHVNQGGANGYLAGRLGELGRGLAAFSAEMQPVWNDTIVVVASEFGRTFRENGDKGTDHGHGSAYWVMGGGIRGGRLLGDEVKVEQATLFQNRDFPVLNEYRSVLGGLFKRCYGFSNTQIAEVFPATEPKDIQLL
jgi:uncharacterized protein (DUF1501 family)